MVKPGTPYFRTRLAVILSSIFHEPLSSLYPLLPFIFLNHFDATAFQIVLLTTLKPVSSIFSFYWSEKLSNNHHSGKWNLLGAGLLARLPLLFSLFVHSTWLLLFSTTLYMLFSRASVPAWMEILKINLPDQERKKIFSLGSALGYAEGVLIAIGIGSLLDRVDNSWQILFCGAIFLGLIGLFLQVLLPEKEIPEKTFPHLNLSWKESFFKPWIDCYELMKKRSDFRRFQWGFMICGFGLMIIQPVLPFFFTDTLHISYRDLMIAFSLCKGLGFVATTPLWNRLLNRGSIRLFTSLVHTSFALFPVLIIFSLKDQMCLYAAYLLYGIAQAGSHLIWHLSGPLFAREEISSRYSSVNVVLVGIRGLLGPPLGGILFAFTGAIPTLFFGALLCVTAQTPMLVKSPKRLSEPG